MEDIIIRTATLADIEHLRILEQGVIIAERPYDSTLKDDPLQYYNLDELITSSSSKVVVAEKDGQLIASGYARIQPTKHYTKHARFAYLDFMFVQPEFRGQGINQRIMDALKDWAKEQGLTEMRLEVYHGNEPAIRAYEKYGFKKVMIEMRMGLE